MHKSYTLDQRAYTFENSLFGAAVCTHHVAEMLVNQLRIKDIYFERNKHLYLIFSRLLNRTDVVNQELVILECDCLALDDDDRSELKTYIALIAEPMEEVSVQALIKRSKDLSARRAFKQVLSKYSDSAFDLSVDTDQMLNAFENDWRDLRQCTSSTQHYAVNLSNVILEWVTDLYENEEGSRKIPTGFATLDSLLDGGFSRGDLCVIAARPSAGKTSFAMNILQNVAFGEKKDALFVSLEMSCKSLVERYASYISNLRRSEFMNEDFLRKILQHFVNHESDDIEPNRSPIHFLTETYTIDQIESSTRAFVRDVVSRGSTPGIIVIDYLQCILLSANERTTNRNYELGEITKRLKRLAVELEVPVILLSQMNRNIEQTQVRKSNEPRLSDLRDSGEIENHADIVAFITKHNDKMDVVDKEEKPVNLYVVKNRNGPVDVIKMYFSGRRFYFREERAPKPTIQLMA